MPWHLFVRERTFLDPEEGDDRPFLGAMLCDHRAIEAMHQHFAGIFIVLGQDEIDHLRSPVSTATFMTLW
jgi:hypothetical protein